MNWNPSKDDVVAVCESIVTDWYKYDECSNGWHYVSCRHCCASIKEINGTYEDLKHDLDCPYLIAQDILTGAQ